MHGVRIFSRRVWLAGDFSWYLVVVLPQHPPTLSASLFLSEHTLLLTAFPSILSVLCSLCSLSIAPFYLSVLLYWFTFPAATLVGSLLCGDWVSVVPCRDLGLLFWMDYQCLPPRSSAFLRVAP